MTLNIPRQSRQNTSKDLVHLACRPATDNLRGRVAIGAAWQFGLVGSRIAFTILSTAILARLLTPNDYGLNGMASIVVELAALLTNMGFSSILIQRRRVCRIHLDSVYWASLGIGLALFSVVVILSIPASWFFKQPELIGILCASATTLILREAAVVPYAILNRLLLFKADALLQFTALTVRILSAITLAWLGAGYWSLVLAPVISALFEVVAATIYVGYKPRLRFSRHFFSTTWRQSGSYLGSSILYYLLSNFDNMVVARRFGAIQLGYYQTAYSLPEELRNRFAHPIIRVLFPAYSLLQGDLSAFRSAVDRSQRMLAALVLPLGTGLAVTAEYVVHVLYGEKWLPIVPLLQILAVGGGTRAMFSLVGSIFSAKGHPELAFRVAIGSIPFTLPVIFIASFWGTEGVAWAMLLAQIPAIVGTYLAMRLIEASPWSFYKAVLPASLASLIMAVSLLTADRWHWFGAMGYGQKLAAMICCGAAIYIAALCSLSKKSAQDFIGAFQTLTNRSSNK